MEEKIKSYQEKFGKIIQNIKDVDNSIEAKEVAETAMELVQDLLFFTNELKDAKMRLASVARDYIVSEVDGKAISAAKAQVLTDASDEAGRYEELKMHVTNFDQIISILKIYIRSLAKEYSLQGPM